MRVSSIDVGLSAAVLGLSLLTGCSFDSASDPTSLGDASDTDMPTPGSGEGLETAGLDDGSGSAGEGGTTGAQPPGDDSDTGDAATCEADCGEGGSCELDEDGAPYCACIEGYAAYGLRCLPCVATDGNQPVDVPSVTVNATFLLDGEPFPDSVYQRGRIVLRDPVSGDEVPLGDTRDGGGEATVVPGTYEVYYAWTAGGSAVPANRGARLATVKLEDDEEGEPIELPITVSMVEVSGSVTFNEAAPPDSQYENGTLVLVDEATGDEVPLGDTRDGSFQVQVIPGVYRVHYRRKLAESLAPINPDASIETVVVQAGVEQQTLDLDVPVATLSGAITLDAQTPPKTIYENGRIVLRNVDTGEQVMLGETADGQYEVPVVQGQYQVIYERLQGGQQVPVNRAALLGELSVGSGPQTHDVDVPTAVVTGEITVAGGAPPSDPGDDGLVLLRNRATGDEALLGNTAVGTYTQRVVRGTYDVYYRQETSSGGVPVNTNARLLPDVVVQGGAALDIDVPMVTVSADVTVGGQAPPESVYDDGVIYLRNAETGDSVLLGNTRLSALQRPVVPGTYDVLYVVEAAGPTMPINAHSHLATVEVGPSTAFQVDIPVAVLQGPITIGGEAPAASIYNRASLLLHDVATNDVVFLGSTDAGAFARTLTAGTYVLVYQALTSTGLIPANTNAGLTCIELLAP